MTENAKQLHNSNDEVMWRMRALKHTARSLAAKSRKGDPCSLYLNTSSRLWIPTPHLDCIAMT